MEDSAGGVPRTIRAVRNQMELTPQVLDDLLTEDHPARSVWSFIERMDMIGEGRRREAEGG